MLTVKNAIVRDYLLLLLFTGLRRCEAATLQWSDVDFKGKVLTIRAEIAKNNTEHRLPLSDFLLKLLQSRFEANGTSTYVFPGRGGKHHLVDPGHVSEGVQKRCALKFMLHDLRRTFLTTAEKLEVPHYALKKLANHVSRGDVTGGYIVVDVERLRGYMAKISDHFVALCQFKNSPDEKGVVQQCCPDAHEPGPEH